MEMPDTIYAWPTNPKSDVTADYFADKSNWNNTVTTTYHHDRVYQAVVRQRDELQAKLDKAKDFIKHMHDFNYDKDRARTTLEEIE